MSPDLYEGIAERYDLFHGKFGKYDMVSRCVYTRQTIVNCRTTLIDSSMQWRVYRVRSCTCPPKRKCFVLLRVCERFCEKGAYWC